MSDVKETEKTEEIAYEGLIDYIIDVYEERWEEQILDATSFHVDVIAESSDIEVIKTCIDCILVILHDEYDITVNEVKNDIINGVGIFNKINKKCIKLGVL